MERQTDRASFRFIALMGVCMASVAFAIDLMMSSLVMIGQEMSPAQPEKAQLVIGVFFFGLGVGTFVVGPISDAVGRRPTFLWGMLLYIIGAGLAWQSQSLEMMLIGRALQGLGASCPRVAIMAVIRDRFEGRTMARTTSYIMTIFTLIPGVAPLIGYWIAELAGWRSVFLAFVPYATLCAVWFYAQQPETLPANRRKPLRIGILMNSFRTVVTTRQTVLATAVQTLHFASLYMMLSSSPLIFEEVYGVREFFPYAMAIASLAALPTSLGNAALVQRLGMVVLMRMALCVSIVGMTTAGLWLWFNGYAGTAGFTAFLILKLLVFLPLGFVIGNSNALALQPLGHIAGTASSMVTATSSVLAGGLGLPFVLAFDASPMPAVLGCLLFMGVATGVSFLLSRD